MDMVATDCGLLNEDQIDSMAEAGFLAVDHITVEPDVKAIRAICERLMTTRAGFKEGALFDALGAAENEPPRFTQIINPHNYAPELRETEFFRNAQTAARQVLGPNARFATDLLLVKPPRTGGATPWHQDEAFRDPAYDRHDVSFWLPLQAVDQVNGCMSFLPGSNHGPVLEHRLLGGDARVHALECCGDFEPAQAIACPLPMGGATLHGGRTLHYAGPNRSDAPRFAYVVIFDTPPTPATEMRTFAWQSAWKTDRIERARQWRRRGGFMLEIWRGLRKVGMNPKRLMIYARRFLLRNRTRPAPSTP